MQAGAYVARKISSVVRGDEQKDQPVLTPCSLAANKRQSQKRLKAEEMSSPDLDDGATDSSFNQSTRGRRYCSEYGSRVARKVNTS
ncbi:hypothetical protein KOW79_005562 [Hemibagrus wyckioides]|uniref:Uncharacterized protein n=1 Tax=Hemibagrus wyckioides TaxID=337641 RepID=A0A9D3SUA0_9TELE|nr:hypothetical protein KOW79_005562 [Hemibagrus wyckioides]